MPLYPPNGAGVSRRRRRVVADRARRGGCGRAAARRSLRASASGTAYGARSPRGVFATRGRSRAAPRFLRLLQPATVADRRGSTARGRRRRRGRAARLRRARRSPVEDGPCGCRVFATRRSGPGRISLAPGGSRVPIRRPRPTASGRRICAASRAPPCGHRRRERPSLLRTCVAAIACGRRVRLLRSRPTSRSPRAGFAVVPPTAAWPADADAGDPLASAGGQRLSSSAHRPSFGLVLGRASRIEPPHPLRGCVPTSLWLRALDGGRLLAALASSSASSIPGPTGCPRSCGAKSDRCRPRRRAFRRLIAAQLEARERVRRVRRCSSGRSALGLGHSIPEPWRFVEPLARAEPALAGRLRSHAQASTSPPGRCADANLRARRAAAYHDVWAGRLCVPWPPVTRAYVSA